LNNEFSMRQALKNSPAVFDAVVLREGVKWYVDKNI